MSEREQALQRLHDQRPRLRALAHHILGSAVDAEDAVQETWLRVHRSPPRAVGNIDAWLTTAVAHTCLDLLRARRSRREYPSGTRLPDPLLVADHRSGPEEQALLSDSVSLAMQAVLTRLDPAERVAFVLHDIFAVPFDRIAALLDRTPAAARQSASRARRRLRAAPTPEGDLGDQRVVVDAFFAAARRGDFEALVAQLAPDIVLRADAGAGGGWEIHGPRDTATRALLFARPSSDVRPVLVNGAAGAVIMFDGQPGVLIAFTVTNERIAEIYVYADRERVAGFFR
ncbi:sigma-70 family RNA polymerase sigma factor [Nocardia cerradoensis]|uniref:sigma-70 family RNA polymerase sigma factor n=1 Tax=Nocardia cerradoensis TaxID=85688 RepID=UPI0002E006BD|nr:sigma-70 family RNA polymerase sigma factor [Nocardia cerradoensis]NKY45973.1 sigma-70 family RNA polymerase sigma factor [Nocardia cerradoensis]